MSQPDDPTGGSSSLPVSFERGTVTENGPVTSSQPLPLFVPPQKRVAPIVDGAGAKDRDIAKALAAGKNCQGCRFFDLHEGQRRFTKERLGQAIVRELAWKPEWWNPADYGACGINPRDAVHKDATCPEWQPKGRAVSFWSKMTAR